MLVQQQEEDLFLVAAMPSCSHGLPGQLNPHARWNAPLCREYNLYDMYVNNSTSNHRFLLIILSFQLFSYSQLFGYSHMIDVQRKEMVKCVLIDISYDVILSESLSYTCMVVFRPMKQFCGIYLLSAEKTRQIHSP